MVSDSKGSYIEDKSTVEKIQGSPLALGPRNFEPLFSLCFGHPILIFPRNSRMKGVRS